MKIKVKAENFNNPDKIKVNNNQALDKDEMKEKKSQKELNSFFGNEFEGIFHLPGNKNYNSNNKSYNWKIKLRGILNALARSCLLSRS